VLQAGNAGRELEAKQGAQSKDMIGIAAAIWWQSPPLVGGRQISGEHKNRRAGFSAIVDERLQHE